MTEFQRQWQDAVQRKQSLLCVGIDAAEPQQRASQHVPEGKSKLAWTLELIDKVSSEAAAIKINRNYYKDISRTDMRAITGLIRERGMLSIDDTKLADIGATNATGIYHAAVEGFDALTYAPFPGNTLEAAEQARQQKIGLICLVLMSNPEFRVMKEAQIHGKPFYLYLAEQAAAANVDAVVIGAPSPDNHIRDEDLQGLAERLPHAAVLVPGIGAQGGEIGPILRVFGKRTIANVGRSIIYADDPAREARKAREAIMREYGAYSKILGDKATTSEVSELRSNGAKGAESTRG